MLLSASHTIAKRAVTESWTQDLFLTKEVLYHWAITAVRAENGTQTRDPQLGRLVLYQLSYFRVLSGWWWIRTTEARSSRFTVCPIWPLWKPPVLLIGKAIGGRWRIRTADPLLVRQMLWTSWAKRPIASCFKSVAKIRLFPITANFMHTIFSFIFQLST